MRIDFQYLLKCNTEIVYFSSTTIGRELCSHIENKNFTQSKALAEPFLQGLEFILQKAIEEKNPKIFKKILKNLYFQLRQMFFKEFYAFDMYFLDRLSSNSYREKFSTRPEIVLFLNLWKRDLENYKNYTTQEKAALLNHSLFESIPAPINTRYSRYFGS